MSRAVLVAILLTSSIAFAADEEPAYPPPPPPPAPQADPAPTPYYPAQVPYTPGPAPQYAPQYVYAPPQVEGLKDSWTAGMLSLGATVAPPLIATLVMSSSNESDREDVIGKIALTSVMIGPSVGHMYAGKFLTPGIAVRTLGFAVAMTAASADDLGDALGRIMIGSLGILSGAIMDLATVGKSVREYNAEHVRVSPMVTPVVDQNGNRGVQIGVNGAF